MSEIQKIPVAPRMRIWHAPSVFVFWNIWQSRLSLAYFENMSRVGLWQSSFVRCRVMMDWWTARILCGVICMCLNDLFWAEMPTWDRVAYLVWAVSLCLSRLTVLICLAMLQMFGLSKCALSERWQAKSDSRIPAACSCHHDQFALSVLLQNDLEMIFQSHHVSKNTIRLPYLPEDNVSKQSHI